VAGKEMKQTYEPDGHGTEAATKQAVELLLSILGQVQEAVAVQPFTTTQDEEAKRNASFAGAAFSIVDRALAFLPGVTLDTVSPSSGSKSGGTPGTISGSNFVPGATLRFGDQAATDVTVVSTTEIQARTPAATATGAVDVTVTSFGGETRRGGAYTYN
jgi:IPT/TIG domain